MIHIICFIGGFLIGWAVHALMTKKILTKIAKDNPEFLTGLKSIRRKSNDLSN